MKPDENLAPIDTGLKSEGSFDKEIKAVLFDIYGTLLISGSGDVGTALEAGSAEAFRTALSSAGISGSSLEAAELIRTLFFRNIDDVHTNLRKAGYPSPEVDIVMIWKDILGDPRLLDMIPEISSLDPVVISAAYEACVNPVNIMPGADMLLNKIKDSGRQMGIISNAQFYTPIVFEQCFEGSFSDFGFDPSLCLFSYIEKRSKPDTFLFEKITSSLAEHGISPAETVFVGNDMLKDIMPAALMGYKTALFAGDKRSLRLREDHDACSNIKPDVIVTSLLDLFDFFQEG